MVSGSSGHLRTTLGAPRYQALWWDMEGITMVSGGSATLPDRLRTTEIPSTLVGHGRNHDGIWRVWVAKFEIFSAIANLFAVGLFGASPSGANPRRNHLTEGVPR